MRCVKFGSVLKTGILSPVYFNLRTIVSFTELMVSLCQDTLCTGKLIFGTACTSVCMICGTTKCVLVLFIV